MLFRQLGEHMSSAAMTFSKGIIASTLLLALVLILPGAGANGADARTMLLLALSGIAGISLGDTLYFAALTRLGPRLTLMLGTMIPIITALGAALLLGETPPASASGGLLLILAGIAWVLWVRTGPDHRRHRLATGLPLAAGFILANTAGILLTKIGVSNIGSMEATLYREAAATFALGLWGVFAGGLITWIRPLQDRRLYPPLLAAALIGTFLGTWLSVAALKYTYTAVAATLNAASPLFIIPITYIILREPIDGRAVVGAGLSVAGVAWYYLAV